MPEYGKNGSTLNLEHLIFKANSAASWNADYVLAAGELGIELDTKKAKLGDGTSKWSALDYYTDPVIKGVVDTLSGKVTTAEGTISSHGTRLDTAEAAITSHGTRLDTAEGNISSQDTRLTTAEGNITSQGTRLDTAEGNITSQGTRLDTAEGNITSIQTKDTEQDGRLDALEGITIISANPFRE